MKLAMYTIIQIVFYGLLKNNTLHGLICVNLNKLTLYKNKMTRIV